MYCIQCGEKIPEGQHLCPFCNNHAGQQKKLGMGWFKFIIHVQLFLSIIAYFLMAIVLFTGGHYGIDSYNVSKQVYLLYPSLETADKLYGVGVFGLAIFAIVVRNMLKKFKAKGPMVYYVFLVLRFMVSGIYLVAASSAMHMSLGDIMTSGNYISFLENVILICVNIIYFRNRKHLFVR